VLGYGWQQEGVLPSTELAAYLWAPGPAVYFLKDVVALGRFQRCVCAHAAAVSHDILMVSPSVTLCHKDLHATGEQGWK
jgi:hypothetical protein